MRLNVRPEDLHALAAYVALLAASSPQYLPSPPAQVAALDAFDSLAGQHGIHGPLVLTGWSAGGHLTALMLEHPR